MSTRLDSVGIKAKVSAQSIDRCNTVNIDGKSLDDDADLFEFAVLNADRSTETKSIRSHTKKHGDFSGPKFVTNAVLKINALETNNRQINLFNLYHQLLKSHRAIHWPEHSEFSVIALKNTWKFEFPKEGDAERSISLNRLESDSRFNLKPGNFLKDFRWQRERVGGDRRESNLIKREHNIGSRQRRHRVNKLLHRIVGHHRIVGESVHWLSRI